MKLAREGQKIVKANKVECVSCKDKSSTNCLKCKFCKRMTHESCARKFISEESISEKISNPGTFSCKECIVHPTINPEPAKDNLILNFESEEQLMIEMSTLPQIEQERQKVIENSEATNIVEDIAADIIFNASSNTQAEENHACTLCDIHFTSESDLNTHIASHEANPKQCDECRSLKLLNEQICADNSAEVGKLLNEIDEQN